MSKHPERESDVRGARPDLSGWARPCGIGYVFAILVAEPQSPSFEHEENGESIPQGIEDIESQ